MDAVYDPWSRTLYAFYRTHFAPNGHKKVRARDLMLLSTEDAGGSFQCKLTDNWRYQRDLTVLARLDLEPLIETVMASWEGRGSVFTSAVRRNYNTVALALEPRADGKGLWRRSASAMPGRFEDVLLAWVERPEDQPEADPTIRWRVYHREQRGPLGDGRSPGPCGDSYPAVLARSRGGYTIVY
jgi:hypothetical protein